MRYGSFAMSRTLDRFPKMIRSIETISVPVAEVIRQHQSVDSIPYMIVIPPGAYPVPRTAWGFALPFGWRKTPERTLVFGQDTLMVIEVEQSKVSTAISIPLAALFEVHLFQMLLYSWIELVWADHGGVKVIKVEYNSVGERLIWRGVTQIRNTFPRHTFQGSDTQPGMDLADFPFKFRSYLHGSLMAEEHLATAVYQPAIRPKPKRWQRFISPNRTVAVTDRNIIVIEDQRNRFRRGDVADADYAISQHFHPLAQLQHALVESGSDADRLRLRFGNENATYDVAIPMVDPHTQQLCDWLHHRISQWFLGVSP